VSESNDSREESDARQTEREKGEDWVSTVTPTPSKGGTGGGGGGDSTAFRE
jgi:hypothetical protein